MSHAETMINFDSSGYILLCGHNNCNVDCSTSNGSGKSSIWDALSWCLTGETIRGAKDIIRKNSTDGCRVSLNFFVDSDEYTLIRSKDDIELKTNLKIFVNGEDKSGKGIRDSEKILKDLLPDVTSQLLGNVVILGQGMPIKFSNYSPSGRKELLEKLSKSDFMIEDLKIRVSNRESFLTNEIAKINAEINLTKSQINNCEQNIAYYTNVYNKLINTDINSVTNDINLLEYKNKSLTDDINYNNQTILNIESDINRESDISTNSSKKFFDDKDKITSKYNSKLLTIDNEINSYKLLISNYNKELLSLSSIKDVCPTCGQKIVGVVIPDTTELKSKLTDANDCVKKLLVDRASVEKDKSAELTKIKSNFDDFLKKSKDILLKLSNDRNTLMTEINNNYKVIDNNKSEIFRLQSKIDNYNNSLSSINDELNKANSLLDSLNNSFSDLNNKIEALNASKTIIDKFKTILSRNFRGLLLQNCINYIDSVVKDYAQEVFNNTNLDVCIDGNAVSIKFNGKEYESLSGGEQKKVDIIIQLAIRNMLCNYLNFNCNIIVLDEVFDALDYIGCEKISNLLTNKLDDVSSMYIVTHRKDLPISVDNVITIIKNNLGISSVV